MSCLPTVVFPLNIVWMAACLTSVGSRHRLKFLQTLCTNFNTQTMLRYQVTHTPLSLQHSLNALADAYQRAGLAINAKKTEILSLGSHPSPASQPSFTVHGDALNTTQHFTYLGSILASDLDLFHEIQQRIKLASSAFGRLGHRVFFNHNLSVATKVAVYKAICISILLYGCESWVPYRRHIKALEAHQIRCLKHSKCTLVAQENPYIDTSSTKIDSAEHLLLQCQLRWLGHVIRMPSNWLPRRLLYGELLSGHRPVGRPKLSYSDHIKSMLRKCNIPEILNPTLRTLQLTENHGDLRVVRD